jgi:predicted esterase
VSVSRTIRGDDAGGRLTARPGEPNRAVEPGLHRLGLDPRRDALLYVPAGYDAARPAPLVVMLHGAGGNGQNALRILQELADEAGVVLLAPDSRDQTWDVIVGGFGPDVAFIQSAMEETFDRCAVDPAHVAVEGFSDGASYALSLGIANGDLFTHLIAFSPGFAAPPAQRGAPEIYVSHGRADRVLPIDACSRRLVPRLTAAGYTVNYHEFGGAHTVPPDLAAEAVWWFLGRKPAIQPQPLAG